MNLTRARVTAVNHKTGVAEVEPIGSGRGQLQTDIPLPQPYAGRGWGVRVGVELDSIVTIGDSDKGGSRIVTYDTDNKFFRDGKDPDLEDSFKTDPQYKTLIEGEIALQSQPNSLVFLDVEGNISLSTADGAKLELNKETDSLNSLSLNSTSITEGAKIRSGLVKRDIRTDQEKIDDLFLNSFLVQDFSTQEEQDILGVDSQHSIPDTLDRPLVGTFDTEEGIPSILEIPGIKDTPSADKIVRNIKNPAVTEYRVDVNEFSDGITSLSPSEEKENLKEGRLPLGLAGRFAIGTVVDENGLFPRFDLTFGNGSGKGHSDIWKLPGINETNQSTDFRVDLDKSVGSRIANNSENQWVSQGLERFNTAQMMQLVLNTRGADHEGNIPDASNLGSRWALQVDKEGLTKWNIPSATGLDPFRIGRSLLWNLDGSITQSVGKENNADLNSITGTDNDDVAFVNVLEKRLDRSWTADFEGTVEWRIGADSAGQSQMVQADGGLSFYYGKHTSAEDSIVRNIDVSGLEPPSKSKSRGGTSISGRTEGSIELDVGVDSAANKQSMALNADGLIKMTLGSDDIKDSFRMESDGNIRMKVAKGQHEFEMLSSEYSAPAGGFSNGIRLRNGAARTELQLDSNGSIVMKEDTLNSHIKLDSSGTITLSSGVGSKIQMQQSGVVKILAGTSSIEMDTNGIVFRTPGGSFTLDTLGSMVAALGTAQEFSVNGTTTNLNTTFISLGPGAKTSSNNVAVFQPGSIDPLTGNPCAVSGSSTIKTS